MIILIAILMTLIIIVLIYILINETPKDDKELNELIKKIEKHIENQQKIICRIDALLRRKW